MPASRERSSRSSIRNTSDFGQMPKYGKPIHEKPERVNDMYPLRTAGFDQNDVQKGIDKVLGPLSLFAPFTHEDVPDMSPLQLERPVTPIDKEIKTQPLSIEKMSRYVRRRIMAKPDVPYMSIDDQKNLAAIIMGEVTGIWPDIRKQIDDPFLTPSENKELNRRIAVHVVTVCEHLFQHYLEKAQVLNSRGVFSGPANMSRLKAQLSLEANDLLNVLKIRRYIVNDMRFPDAREEQEALTTDRSSPRRQKQRKAITYQSILEASRPKSKQQKSKASTLDHEIRAIQDQMPDLDTSNLADLVAELPDRELRTPSEEGFPTGGFNNVRPSRISEGISRLSGLSKEGISKQRIIHKPESVWSEEDIVVGDEVLQRCHSQPDFFQGETLLEELGIPTDVRRDHLIDNELIILEREREGMDRVKTDAQTKPVLGSRDFIADDLKKLIDQKDDEFPPGDEDDDGDLPPLIQAITRHARHDDIKQRMEKQLKELEEKQKQREEEETVYVSPPTQPQPDTVSSNMGNKGVVRTSDIRVSERVCMSSITLKRHAPVYNDLLEEIDPVTVKGLDKNLFLSDEIREVYKEIMKSVPTTHMELDDLSDKDPLVLNAPESVNVSNTMASASLSKKVVERVINPAFTKDKGPPWGEVQMKDWVRTPANPPKNFLGEDIFDPVTPNMNKIRETMENSKRQPSMFPAMDSLPNAVADKMSRTYASWLQWWKSTLTSDDYMKYLSTLETDYMGAVFHFYDSEEEEDPGKDEMSTRSHRFSRRTHSSGRSKMSNEQKERMKKMNELKSIKTAYKEGFWNANAVLMGGLGKDPELAGDTVEEKVGDKTNRSVDSSKTVTISDRASLTRTVPEKRDLISRMSKTTATSEGLLSNAEADESKHAPQPQERLEKIWQQLQVPDAQRLDMAIKYSSNEYFNRLAEAIERWEMISELVLQREALLIKLEKFERHASDPNRFFDKDSKKRSNRLHESRQRTGLYKKIDSLDLEIKEEIEYVKSRFQDTITFKGRPYLTKMKWDRTEMLYWLSEERKQQGIQYEVMAKGINLPLKPAQLEPIVGGKAAF